MTNAYPRRDGIALLDMFEGGLELLEANVPEVNRLNVFPVPDGDTGTNMYMTLLDVVESARSRRSESVGEISSVMARAALDGGRGNSGVLLSLFFMGAAEALAGRADFGGRDLARCLAAAAVHAYGGIGHPREGTILTVMRESGDAAGAADSDDLARTLSAACAAALDAVERTPTMLAVLHRAGLVDSGGYGFYVILEGMRRRLAGEGAPNETLATPQPATDDGNVSAAFLDEIEEEEYGFCTQFIIRLAERGGDDDDGGLDKDAIMSRLKELGDSPVVIGGGDAVRIHVHTLEPDAVVAYGEGLGEVSNRNIQDMDEQRERYSADRRAEIAQEAPTLVAVAQGAGIEAVLRGDECGVESVVSGGDTMNPSVGDLLHAIEDVSAEGVVVLPNNKNIILAAEQAAARSSKTVRVVPTRTVMQGIAAAMEFPEGKSLDQLVEDMRERISHIRSGAIFSASRDSDIQPGVNVEAGQFVALLEDEIVHSSDTLEGALAGLMDAAIDDTAEIADLYWGESLDADAAQTLADICAERYPNVEFGPVEGGQPHYHLLVSIE